MRINVYSQDLPEDVRLVHKESDEGSTHSGVQLVLGDRDAITFWLPKSGEGRARFADALSRAAAMIDFAPVETGLG